MTQDPRRTKQSPPSKQINNSRTGLPPTTTSMDRPPDASVGTKDGVSPQADKLKFEVMRLNMEIDYHKRLRHGAEQHSRALEEQLSVSRLTSVDALSGYDEAHKGLVNQSQVLHTKNSELTYQLIASEANEKRQKELHTMLETDLDSLYTERDELATTLGKYSEELEALRHLYQIQEQRYQQLFLQQQAQSQQLAAQAQTDQAQQQAQQQVQVQQQALQHALQQAEDASRVSLSGIQTQDCVGAVLPVGAGLGMDLPGTDNSLHHLLDAAQVTSQSDLSRTVSQAEHARR